MNIHALFQEITQRLPSDRELFVHDGHIHVYRRHQNIWEDLGEGNEEGTVKEVGSLQFELQQGIIAEGSPSFILQLLLRAFYCLDATQARDFADTTFNIFKTCGWTGPIESENKTVPGTITIDKDVQEVDDLRVVLAQLQDPNLNGWLQTERRQTTRFTNIGRAYRIDIEREEKFGERKRPDCPTSRAPQADPK